MKEQTQIRPDYYKANGFEAIDFIEAFDFNFNLGNVIKYISRAGHKPENLYLSDLQKAQFYLGREITKVQEAMNM